MGGAHWPVLRAEVLSGVGGGKIELVNTDEQMYFDDHLLRLAVLLVPYEPSPLYSIYAFPPTIF
jgi:hypothetical protein